jgi:acetoin utilization protein AcuB
MNDAISSFMTGSPHTIGASSSLAEARQRMNEYSVRHLPVLESGALVGLVSQRDIQLLESLKDVDPKVVTVEEAMSQDVLSFLPETPLAEVAAKMAERKCGSAIIERGGSVLGIFATIDALKAVSMLLRERTVKRGLRRLPRAKGRPRTGTR